MNIIFHCKQNIKTSKAAYVLIFIMCTYVFTYYNKRWRKHLNAHFINDNNNDCFLQNYLILYVRYYLYTLGSKAYIFTMIHIDRIFLPNEIPNLTQIMVDGLNFHCCLIQKGNARIFIS